MEYYRFIITSFLLLISANLSISSSNHHYGDVHECLTDQFQRSNLETDNVVFSPLNSTYASLLQAPTQRPQSNSPRRPDLIVTPSHESEIQAVIYCSKLFGLHIITRSGGLDFEGLSYTSKIPFVIIDMKNFRSITIASDKKTAWVQTGAKLGEFYHTLNKNGKTLGFAAGVSTTVGIGGQFSGGGYGMMARKHSIAADNIIDARLINADGEILDRKAMGEDLFWAIRGGGGGNFGIVLEFKLTLITVPEIVTVSNVIRTSEQNATELVHKWQYIADKVDNDLLLKVFLKSIKSPTTGKRILSVDFTMLYLGRAHNLLPMMQEKFPELGLVEQDCMEMSWIESVLFFLGSADQPLDTLLDRAPQMHNIPPFHKGKSDFVSTPIPKSGLEGIWRFLHEEDELSAELQFSPYGGAINALSESETPFPHRKGTIFMIEYSVTWSSRKESDTHLSWSRRLHNYMTRYVTKNPRCAYVNYKDLDLGRNNNEGKTSYEQASVWGLSYYKNNFMRLVHVKTKVDPSNIFRNEQSIPPLSSLEII